MFDPAGNRASLTARAEKFADAQDRLAAQSKEDREHWHHVALRDLLRELASAITAYPKNNRVKKPTRRQLNRWIKEDEDYTWGYRPKPTLWRRFLRWAGW